MFSSDRRQYVADFLTLNMVNYSFLGHMLKNAKHYYEMLFLRNWLGS